MKTLGDYYVSRNKSQIDFLALVKQEMSNICSLYDSHHLQIYKSIVDVSFALYIPNADAIRDDEPIEDVLIKMEKVFSTYSKDTNYQFLQMVYNFLAFEYYHKLNLPKKEARYFDVIDKKIRDYLKLTYQIKELVKETKELRHKKI